jgi:hypothetical protein
MCAFSTLTGLSMVTSKMTNRWVSIYTIHRHKYNVKKNLSPIQYMRRSNYCIINMHHRASKWREQTKNIKKLFFTHFEKILV